MNLDGSTTIIVDAEMMVEWVYTVLYSRMFFGKYHLLAYTFDSMVCQIISYAKYVCHKANLGF